METYLYGSLAHAFYKRMFYDEKFKKRMADRVMELCSSSQSNREKNLENNLDK